MPNIYSPAVPAGTFEVAEDIHIKGSLHVIPSFDVLDDYILPDRRKPGMLVMSAATQQLKMLNASGDLTFFSPTMGTGVITVDFDGWTYPFSIGNDEETFLAWDESSGRFWFADPPIYGIAKTELGSSGSITVHDVVNATVSHAVDAIPLPIAYEEPKVTLAGTEAIAIGSIIGDLYQIGSSVSEVDVSHWVSSETHILYVSGGSCIVYFGAEGLRCFGGGAGADDDQFSMTAGSLMRLTKTSTFFVAEVIEGTVTPQERGSVAVRDRSIIGGGQSNSQRFMLHGGVGGMGLGIRDVDHVDTVIDASIRYINGATGGSSIDDYSSEWWLDASGPTVGPAYQNFLDVLDAELAAGQPLPSAIYWDQGEADANHIHVGSFGYEAYKSALAALFADIQSEMGDRGASGNIPIICTLIGSQDDTVTHGGASAVRAAYLETIGSLSYVHQGPEKYDLDRRRFGNVHLDWRGFGVLGRRFARHYANVLEAQTNNLGPTFVSATLSGDNRTATLTFTGTGGLTMPKQPAMFALVRDGDDPSDTPILATATVTSSAQITLTAGESLAGARILYPWGFARDPSNGLSFRANQIIRDSEGLPLRSFFSSALS